MSILVLVLLALVLQVLVPPVLVLWAGQSDRLAHGDSPFGSDRQQLLLGSLSIGCVERQLLLKLRAAADKQFEDSLVIMLLLLIPCTSRLSSEYRVISE